MPADGEAATVDVQALIDELIAEGRPSLELPGGLTAEQRKQAKRLADQHPELKCESYGFGEERRLHIFNTAAKEEKPAVRIKNTFIDDFVGEGGGSGEQAVFRSVPPSLAASSSAAFADRLPDDVERPRIEGLAPTPEATGSESTSLGAIAASGATSALPQLPDGLSLNVRNTFIHFQDEPVTNERTVQSMPNGMYTQMVNEELEQRRRAAAAAKSAESVAAPADASVAAPAVPQAFVPTGVPFVQGAGNAPMASLFAAPMSAPVIMQPIGAPPMAMPMAAPPSAAAPVVAPFAPGTEVTIQGLAKMPDFNGLTGVVQSLDVATGRYDVLLTSPAGERGWRWVKLKGENCVVSMPPPPSTWGGASFAPPGAR